jgi:hypothetical protein
MAFVQVKTPLPAAGAQAPPESQQVTAAAAETAGTTPRGSVVVGSLVAILVAWVVSGAINRESRPAALVVPAGIGLFAMLYAVTQGSSGCWSHSRRSSTAPRNTRRTATPRSPRR